MSKKTSILLVDDDHQLIRLVRTNLEAAGYRIFSATDANSALKILDMETLDLVLLDIMLPGVDGFQLCRRIREFSNVAIVMLTAKVEDTDKVRGLKLGADDYLTKPFSVQELLARIEAVLRRTKPTEVNNAPPSFTCGEITVDFVQRRVTVAGKEVNLTLTEYKLLSQLVNNVGRVMLHHELLTRVWGVEYQDEADYLRAYIRHLRQKLEPNPHEPRYIISKPGIGYMFVCPE